MTKLARFALVALLAVAAVFTVQSASAQMMHFELDITIETEDGSPIPAGTVCISGMVSPICQDIPADTPSGRDFLFTGLDSGDHSIEVNAGDYLEAVDTAKPALPATEVTIVLYKEVTPPSNLPDTGAGVTALEATSPLAMLLIAGSLVLAAGAGAVRFNTRDIR